MRAKVAAAITSLLQILRESILQSAEWELSS
jgi:hypothetical protein